MTGKVLGKLLTADIGLGGGGADQRFGLLVDIKLADGGGVSDFTDNFDHIKAVLNDAKVTKVSRLVGKPIEANLDGNLLTTWRILTEVL